jgi:hypothetical protein
MKGRLGRHYEIDTGGIRLPALALLAGGAVLGTVGHTLGAPCPSIVLVGIPCPFCGLTTALRNVMTGRLATAFTAAPLGVALVATAVYVVVTKRTRWSIPLVIPVVALGAEWVYELFRFGIL